MFSNKLSVKLNSKIITLPKIYENRWLSTFIALVIMGFLIIVHTRLRQYAFDDSYIHFRVARNLVDFGAPYYNPSDMLKVSTSSGWLIFLAMIYWLAKMINMESNFPLLISILNALVSFCGLIVYTKIIEFFLKKLTIHQKLL